MSDANGQLALFPAVPPELRRESIPLELLDGFQDAKPSAKLRELIRDLGLLQPIIVASGESGHYRIIDGRRRTKAIALLAEDGEWPAPVRIETLIVEGHDARRGEVRGGLALAVHASRSPIAGQRASSHRDHPRHCGIGRRDRNGQADRLPTRLERPDRATPAQAPLAHS